MLGAAWPTPVRAQDADTVGLARTVARAREALARMPAIWHISADTVEWLFASPDSAYVTRRSAPGARDYIERFTLPAGTPRANTSVSIDGRRYAMVLLPLGGTPDDRVRLLVHEATHTLQPHLLPNPGNTEPMDGGDLLDGAAGRTWLFLELRALATALTTDGDARRAAARDALLFRAWRDSIATPAERARLDALDLAEGIPSYTAWRLTLADADALAAQLDSAPMLDRSWVRTVAYATGPAYGYLLDALSGPAWRNAHRSGARLPDLLALVLGTSPVTDDLAARARLYGGDEIRRAERVRESTIAQRQEEFRDRFTRGRVLRLIPGSLRVTFDPNRQYPLGDAGTVMMGFRWTSEDGAELVAEDGALVAPDWSYVQLPLGAEAVTVGDGGARTIRGPGWELTLPAGWRISTTGNRTEVRPPL